MNYYKLLTKSTKDEQRLLIGSFRTALTINCSWTNERTRTAMLITNDSDGAFATLSSVSSSLIITRHIIANNIIMFGST